MLFKMNALKWFFLPFFTMFLPGNCIISPPGLLGKGEPSNMKRSVIISKPFSLTVGLSAGIHSRSRHLMSQSESSEDTSDLHFWRKVPHKWASTYYIDPDDGGIIPVFEGNTSESDIKICLLHQYDRTSRPVFTEDTTVNVSVGFSLFHILDTDEKFHTVSTLLSIRLRWIDYSLRWHSDEVKSIYIPANRIWVPDIVFANSAEARNRYTTTNAIVQSNGSVLWMFPILLKTQCNFQIFFFPFDRQKCRIILTSWAYHGNYVDLRPDTVNNNIANYYNPKNQEWYVDEIKASRRVGLYKCCPNDSHPEVVFTLYLRRRSQFYVLHLIYPCVLFYVLSFLGFLLPLESGDKVNMEVIVLLSLLVLMMYINEMLPPTSEMVPAIAMIVVVTMFEVVMALIMAVVVSHMAHRNLHPDTISPSLVWLLEHYGRHVIVEKFKKAVKAKRDYEANFQTIKTTLNKRRGKLGNFLMPRSSLEQYEQHKRLMGDDSTSSSAYEEGEGINVLLKAQPHGCNRKYWIEIASILDRIFFVTFGFFSGCVNLFLYATMILADDAPVTIFTSVYYNDDDFGDELP